MDRRLCFHLDSRANAEGVAAARLGKSNLQPGRRSTPAQVHLGWLSGLALDHVQPAIPVEVGQHEPPPQPGVRHSPRGCNLFVKAPVLQQVERIRLGSSVVSHWRPVAKVHQRIEGARVVHVRQVDPPANLACAPQSQPARSIGPHPGAIRLALQEHKLQGPAHEHIRAPIGVEVPEPHAHGVHGHTDPGLVGHIGERAIVVPPEAVGKDLHPVVIAHVDVQVTVVVQVHPGDGKGIAVVRLGRQQGVLVREEGPALVLQQVAGLPGFPGAPGLIRQSTLHDRAHQVQIPVPIPVSKRSRKGDIVGPGGNQRVRPQEELARSIVQQHGVRSCIHLQEIQVPIVIRIHRDGSDPKPALHLVRNGTLRRPHKRAPVDAQVQLARSGIRQKDVEPSIPVQIRHTRPPTQVVKRVS